MVLTKDSSTLKLISLDTREDVLFQVTLMHSIATRWVLTQLFLLKKVLLATCHVLRILKIGIRKIGLQQAVLYQP